MNKFTEQNKATAKSAAANKPSNGTAHNGSDHEDGQTSTKQLAADKAEAAKQPAADKADIAKQKPIETAPKDAFNGKWQSQIQAAKSNWNKISESELVKSGGVETKLAELVQQRYLLSQDVARKQVKSFIDKCHC